MGVIVERKVRFGESVRRTVSGLRAVMDANGIPDDGGRYVDQIGGGCRLGHQHGHPGCEDYRSVQEIATYGQP